MRTLCLAALFGWCTLTAWSRGASADGDPHAEMAAALAAQADLQPAPLSLPATSAAPRHASAHSAVNRGVGPRSASDAARASAANAASAASAANRVSLRAQAQAASQALAHQAQAAAAAAAGQAQSQAAKERVTHPRPR